MKKLLWGLLILLLILAAVGFYMFNMSGDSVAKKDADHSLTAAALYAEYAKNEKLSNTKYIGKTIELTGTISEISEDQQGATVLMFTEPGEFEGVMCTLDKDQNTRDLKIGSQVKIKGQCTGKLDMTGVVINKGVLLH
jgi:hypothetical protein